MANQNFRARTGLEVGIGGTILLTDVNGVGKVSAGVGTTNPVVAVDPALDSSLAVGVVTANYFFGNLAGPEAQNQGAIPYQVGTGDAGVGGGRTTTYLVDPDQEGFVVSWDNTENVPVWRSVGSLPGSTEIGVFNKDIEGNLSQVSGVVTTFTFDENIFAIQSPADDFPGANDDNFVQVGFAQTVLIGIGTTGDRAAGYPNAGTAEGGRVAIGTDSFSTIPADRDGGTSGKSDIIFQVGEGSRTGNPNDGVGIASVGLDLYVGRDLVVGGVFAFEDVDARNLQISGISTLASAEILDVTVGGATTTRFISTQTDAETNFGLLEFVGTAATARTSANIGGGQTGFIPYQSDVNETVFLGDENRSDGFVVRWDEAENAPVWDSIGSLPGSTRVTIREEGTIVGTAVSDINFVGSNILADVDPLTGVAATITVRDDLVGVGLSITGISTIAPGANGGIVLGLGTGGAGDPIGKTAIINVFEGQTTSTAQENIVTLSAVDFRTVEFVVQATDTVTSNYHSTKLLSVHNGTDVETTEFATIFTDDLLADYGVDIINDEIVLSVVAASANQTDYLVHVTGIGVTYYG